jgi:hypothetical protein
MNQQILKRLSVNWLKGYTKKEIDQEELIQSWKNPGKELFQGLFAYRSLATKLQKEKAIEARQVELDDNLLDRKHNYTNILKEIESLILSMPVNLKAKCCLLLGRLLKEEVLGKNIKSERDYSKHLGASKSSLNRLLNNFRNQITKFL